MKLSPAQSAELVELVSQRSRRARVQIAGPSMRPLLRAGMVVDIEPLAGPPRIGEILVFKSLSGLVAHRLVAPRNIDETTSAYVTAGDAHPDLTEVVMPHLVVGRVTAVWSSAEPDARRIDDPLHKRLGTLFARTRRWRSLAVKVRAYALLLLADPARIAPPPAFSALARATREFERGRYGAGVALLCSVPRRNLIEMAGRHHASGLIARWLDEASQSGVAVPDDLREEFQRIRWAIALQAGRVLSCVRDVRDRFDAAAIPHIFLKGGARLAADASGADLQFSSDVDVLVPAELADGALATLRSAGYRELYAEHERARYERLHHHRAALRPPHVDVPVEVHVALAARPLVSRRLDYEALLPSSRLVTGPAGEVRVLDDVAAAVHLAYHARDLHVWRDIVLLSRLIRNFDAATRLRFDAYVMAEKRDGLRVASAVAAADAIASGGAKLTAAMKRYIRWAMVREDLPARIAHVDIAEAFAGRCRMPDLRRDHAPSFATWLRIWLRNLVLLPAIVRFARHRSKTNGAQKKART